MPNCTPQLLLPLLLLLLLPRTTADVAVTAAAGAAAATPVAVTAATAVCSPLVWILMLCSLFVALSLADTCTMPLASMSNVT
jgi:hypothetical protein